jgi:polyisoprenyl-phosphate glycosyltransferase
MKISICIPVYNGQLTINSLVGKIRQEIQTYDLEFVLVNDGSSDRSHEVCLELAMEHLDITYICLRKNSGEHNAVMCALNHITGDFAVIIDDDFQNPPKEILTLVNEAEKGFDVVYSKYKEKMHSPFRNFGSNFNNLVATWLLDKPRELYLSSFKLIRADVVREIVAYKGPYPYIDGLLLRVTRNISSVYVRHEARSEGRSNYTLKKLVSLWLNMFVNFSVKPLRFFAAVGFITVIISGGLIIYFVSSKVLYPEQNYGWTSIMTAIVFFAGVQILFLGLIAEYLGKQYLTINLTPQWTIKHIVKGRDRK